MGSTRRQLKVRIQEHILHIRKRVLEAPLIQRFIELQHSSTDLSCVVLEILKESATHTDLYRVLLQRKSFWIFRLRSLIPQGLN